MRDHDARIIFAAAALAGILGKTGAVDEHAQPVRPDIIVSGCFRWADLMMKHLNNEARREEEPQIFIPDPETLKEQPSS